MGPPPGGYFHCFRGSLVAYRCCATEQDIKIRSKKGNTMRKILLCSIGMLLYSLFATAQTPKQWKTVQVKTVTGSANVLSETLFTPTTAAAYRISATFVGQPVESPMVGIVAFFWTDRLGQFAESVLKTGAGASSDWGSTVFMFNPVTGKPVTYEIEINEGAVSSYRLELTVEELE